MGKLLLTLVSLGAVILLVSHQVASEASAVASEDVGSKSKVSEDVVAVEEAKPSTISKRAPYPPGVCPCHEYDASNSEEDRRKRHPGPKPGCVPPPGLCCCGHNAR